MIFFYRVCLMMFDDVFLIVNYFIYLLSVGLVIIEFVNVFNYFLLDKMWSLFNKLMYYK